MKKFLSILLISVFLILLMPAFVACEVIDNTIVLKSGVYDVNGYEYENGKVYPMPSRLLFSGMQLLSAGGGVIGEVTLQATISPPSAINKKVDWNVSWVNSSSEFSSGKLVTDYVKIAPQSDGSLIANVKCYNAFAEQVKITVTSRENNNVKAECFLDFAQRYSEFGFEMFSLHPDILENYNFVSSSKFNDYTFKLNQEIINPLMTLSFWNSYGSEFYEVGESVYTVNNNIVLKEVHIKRSDALVSAMVMQNFTNITYDWLFVPLAVTNYEFLSYTYLSIISTLCPEIILNIDYEYEELDVIKYFKLLMALSSIENNEVFTLRITYQLQYGGIIYRYFNCKIDPSSPGLAVENLYLNAQYSLF